MDAQFADDITENLFDGAVSGMDLVALNIQRGRDHGIPGYNEYRKICQVGNARTFDDLSNTISREVSSQRESERLIQLIKLFFPLTFYEQNIAKLRRAYQRVEDIDLFVGMYLENGNYNGAFVGRTFLCLIGDQFARSKKGDRCERKKNQSAN